MTRVADATVHAFVDAGMLAAETGVLPRAAGELADRLLAEGHADALAQVTAEFWMRNEARKAHADQWAAYERASLDKTGQQPPPPPPDEDPPPPPDPEPGK